MTQNAHETPAEVAAVPLPRIQAEEVAEIVKNGAAGSSVAVVDVREPQEFAAGHIKGAHNLDSSAFSNTEAVDKLVQQLQPSSQVVVHCAKSLQRGPASAAALKTRLVELGLDREVVVMEGGFDRFSELYATDSAVVEKTPAPTQ